MGGSIDEVVQMDTGERKQEWPGWRKLTITADSGVVDTVGPEEFAKEFRTRDTNASRSGLTYVAANGLSLIHI